MLSLQIGCSDPVGLQTLLYEKYRIEIPVIPFDGKVYIRYSINGFNSSSDLDKLYEALKQIQAEGKLLANITKG